MGLREDVLDTLKALAPHAAELGSGEALARLAADLEANRTDAAWLRRAYRERGSLNDVARMQSDLWMGLTRPAAR